MHVDGFLGMRTKSVIFVFRFNTYQKIPTTEEILNNPVE